MDHRVLALTETPVQKIPYYFDNYITCGCYHDTDDYYHANTEIDTCLIVAFAIMITAIIEAGAQTTAEPRNIAKTVGLRPTRHTEPWKPSQIGEPFANLLRPL